MKTGKNLFLFLFCFIFSCISYAQNSLINEIHLTNVETSIQLFSGWKFNNGDDRSMSAPSFDDSKWIGATTELSPENRATLNYNGMCWFRLHIEADSALSGKMCGLMIVQKGASEIYFDGKLIYEFGKVSSIKKNEEPYNPQNIPVAIRFDRAGPHVIAVRYSNHSYSDNASAGFSINIREINGAASLITESGIGNAFFLSILMGFFTGLSLLHFFLFFYYKAQKTNLYYALFTGGISLIFSGIHIARFYHEPAFVDAITFTYELLIPLVLIALLSLVHSLFNRPFSLFYKLNVIVAGIFIILKFMHIPHLFYLVILLLFSISISSIINITRAVIKKQDGAKILATGMYMFIISFIIYAIYSIISDGNVNINNNDLINTIIVSLMITSVLSIPISMSLYLARQFAQINKKIGQQLIQVRELSEKTIAQDQEKKRILEGQKEELEIQVTVRTAEVVHQKKIIEEKNKDITDSINYAKLIQEAILPSKEIKYRIFPKSFILFQPRDIVSGDFYWFSEKNGKRIIAAADCTGHGVPGAFMSMIGNSFLNEIVNEKGIIQPSEILNLLRANIIKSLNQSNAENVSGAIRQVQDGMDIALCMFDENNNTVEFSGANNPVWIIRNGELKEYKGDKQPIGLYSGEAKPFTNNTIKLEKGDSVYIFTDGFADQFGGKAGKKFKYKQLMELLISIQEKEMIEQENILARTINEWKGDIEQVDDILVIGIKI
jgi:serine phosphatase RsbU (regulator of sigma subunit)